MSHRRTWYNAESLRTGGGAVERASLENWCAGDTPINETNDTAKTYDDSGSGGEDALAPHLRTDPELAAIVEVWPGLPPAMRTAIVALVRASG